MPEILSSASVTDDERLRDVPSPCFVVEEERLRSTIETINRLLPGEVLYSLKTNPHPRIAEIVASHGCGFLLSSVEELEAIIRGMGADPSGIMFQSPSLTADQYRRAKAAGVTRYIVDSDEQLDLVLASLREEPPVTEILVRVNTGVTVAAPELPYSTDSFLGFPVEDAVDVFERLDRNLAGRGVRIGLHNHLLSQNTFPELWTANLDALAHFVDMLREQGLRLDAVDFGGGYPIDYGRGSLPLEEIATLIAKTTARMRRAYPDLRFIFEPGRKVVGESITLVATVAHVKTFRGANVAILDASLYNSSLDTLVVGLHLPVAKIGADDGPKMEYVLRGSTPDSLDVFSRKALLPKLAPGDRIAFLHAGAYSFWSDFISLKKPEHVFI